MVMVLQKLRLVVHIKDLPDEIKDGNKELMISIGKPLCNCKMYILDENMKPVPIGVEGEIFIGGYGVGKGYLNRPELTQEKFIINPFIESEINSGNVMYRTGDLGKWTEEGEIICLGRIDFQVKIRGQRIELSEIENTISEMEQIENSIVLDMKKENGEQYLVGYYISNSSNINGNQIKNYLKEKLPQYMIPTYFIKINEIPVTNNGKLNRKALPEPSINDMIKEEYIAPETDIEKEICNIYSQIFKIDVNEIGKNSNFYDLGGDSMNAIQCLLKIKKAFNINITIKDIISHSLLSDLAEYIRNKTENIKNDNSMEIIKKNSSLEYPVENLFGVNSTKNGNIDFDVFNSLTNNTISYFKLNEPISIGKLNEMMNIIIQRHNALRTIFFEKQVNGKKKLYGKVIENVKFEVEEYDITNFFKFRRKYDASKDLLIRVGLIDNTILMIDMDHSVSDGYSFSVLLNELCKLYYNEPLDELPIQVNDYYNQCFKDCLSVNKNYLEHYRSMFNEKFDVLKLSKNSMNNNDNKAKTIKQAKGFDILIAQVDKEIYENVEKVIKNNNLSKTTFFFAVYCFNLAVYSGQRKVYSDILIANRMDDDICKLIGLFMNLIPVLVKIENMTFIDYIKKVSDLLMTLINLHVPYEIISDEFHIPRSTSNFKFDPYSLIVNEKITNFADFITDEEIYKLYNREDLISTNIKPPAESRVFNDIVLVVSEKKDSYSLQLLYNGVIYDKALMEDFINSYVSLIKNEEYLYENVDKLLSDNNKFMDKIDRITQFLSIEMPNDSDTVENEQEDNETTISIDEQDKNNLSLIENSKSVIQLEEIQSSDKDTEEKSENNYKKNGKKNKFKSIIQKVVKSVKVISKIKKMKKKNHKKIKN
ncbi:hypothetical protein PIROE2DRAFT_17815 [Piromyces sp. E2]|nr:hypothetical protein PIROE2DRAFT_17815 [Piromyces sp. E2]|eukprot:OUM57261.1 hypothetical protein PIROE2DRAFT_17815 [Piromyces sp. E2]